jgi:hypothetical protein
MGRDIVADDLLRQSEAARALVMSLADRGDDELTNDMVEGETSILEAIDRALVDIDENEAMAFGLASKIAEFSARKSRCESRVERVRTLIEQALVTANIPSLKTVTATLSVKSVPPKPIVTDEAEIPAAFWKSPDPVLDKKAINDAVKAGQSIPGVSMTNGSTSLQIRRS